MISVIPDRVLIQALKEGILAIRNSPKILATLFQNLTDPEFERVVSFITKSPLSLMANYPRSTITPPCIVLTLQAESEELTFLGDHMGTSPGYGLPPQEHVYDTSVSAASTSEVTGLGVKVLSNAQVAADSGDKIYINTAAYKQWYVSYAEGEENVEPSSLTMHVISGTGRGQVVDVTMVNPEYIDIVTPLTVSLDSTSRIDLRLNGDNGLKHGEPARFYNEDDIVSRKGAYYSANYSLDVICGSQEEVIYLYSIVKSIFFLFKASLESQGIQNLVLTGSDLVVRNEAIPTELFNRKLNLQFSYPFSVLIEEEVLQGLELCMSPNGGTPINLGTITFD